MKQTGYHSLSYFSRALRIQHFDANRNIINYGERGSKFYIILRGRASVRVPCAYQRYLTELELHQLLISHGGLMYERPELIESPKRRVMRA